MSATPSVLQVMEGFRQRMKKTHVNVTKKIPPGSAMPFHEKPGRSMAQPRPISVKGSSQPRLGRALKCSRKLKTNITTKVGMMNAPQGDSRGNSRRKSTAAPMTWKQTSNSSKPARRNSIPLKAVGKIHLKQE